MELRYLIDLEQNEDGGYSVTVPALPGCITQGATWDEAIALPSEGAFVNVNGKVSSHRGDDDQEL